MPYMYKTIVHLCSLARDSDSDKITPSRLAAETGVTLRDTIHNVQIAVAQSLITIETGTGYLWPTSDGREMARRVAHAVRPEPECYGQSPIEFRDEALTGVVQSGPREGRQSPLTAAVLSTCSEHHYRSEPRLMAREELDKVVSEIVSRLSLSRQRVLMLLDAGAANQPVDNRGILLCPRCNKWQIVRWHKRGTWSHICIDCERAARKASS